MPDSKISDLVELTSVAQEEDLLEIVDTSASANRKVKAATLIGPPSVQETGGSYIFGLTDAFRTKVFNSASAQVATIPLNSSVAVPIGTRVRCYRSGAGSVRVVPDSGVTLSLPTGIKPKRFMGALVRKASDQLTANYTAATAVTWDSETYDTDGFHDNVTNNSRLTIPAGLGIKKVRLVGSIRASAITADLWTNLFITKGGSSLFDGAASFYGTAEAAGEAGSSIASGDIAVADSEFFELTFQVQTDTSD